MGELNATLEWNQPGVLSQGMVQRLTWKAMHGRVLQLACRPTAKERALGLCHNSGLSFLS